MFADGDPNDFEYRRKIITRLVKAVYLYDDKFLLYFNLIDGQDIAFRNITDLENAVKSTLTQEFKGEYNIDGVRILCVPPHHTTSNTNPIRLVFIDGTVGVLLER